MDGGNPCYVGAANKISANATLVRAHENFCSVSVVTSYTTVASHAIWQRSQPKKSATDEHGESRATLQTAKIISFANGLNGKYFRLPNYEIIGTSSSNLRTRITDFIIRLAPERTPLIRSRVSGRAVHLLTSVWLTSHNELSHKINSFSSRTLLSS